jgi:integrase
VKVRTRKYASGKIGYQADLGMVDGKRVQIAFETKKEAEARVAKAKKARALHGQRAMALTAVEMSEVIVAKDRVEAVGGSISEAVEFYLRHAHVVKERVMVPELVRRFVRSREEAGKSERYVRQLRVSLEALGRAFALTGAGDLTREEVQAWLRSGSWAAKTRNNYMGDVRALFSWAMREGFAARSPCEGLVKTVLPDAEISVLKVDGARALLEAARGNGEMMTYVVLAMFGGIRPAEIVRMDAGAIHLGEGTVIVRGGTAKTGARRVVDLSANAVAWLRTVEMPVGRLCPGRWAERWRAFRRGCGWQVGADDAGERSKAFKRAVKAGPITRGKWPADVLRHTFASMHYAQFQNEGLLKAQMGHWERADTLHRHYRALTTRAEAAVFWGLRP